MKVFESLRFRISAIFQRSRMNAEMEEELRRLFAVARQALQRGR